MQRLYALALIAAGIGVLLGASLISQFPARWLPELRVVLLVIAGFCGGYTISEGIRSLLRG